MKSAVIYGFTKATLPHTDLRDTAWQSLPNLPEGRKLDFNGQLLCVFYHPLPYLTFHFDMKLSQQVFQFTLEHAHILCVDTKHTPVTSAGPCSRS